MRWKARVAGLARQNDQRRAVDHAVRHDDLFAPEWNAFAHGAADRRPQLGQYFAMPDQAEQVECRLSRDESQIRADIAAQSDDLHLIVDEHPARDQMRDEKAIRSVMDARIGGAF